MPGRSTSTPRARSAATRCVPRTGMICGALVPRARAQARARAREPTRECPPSPGGRTLTQSRHRTWTTQGWEFDFGNTNTLDQRSLSGEQKKIAASGLGVVALVWLVAVAVGGGGGAGAAGMIAGDSAAADANFDGNCGLRTGAIELDGSTWMQMDNHVDFQPSDELGHQSFTIEQWIRPASIDTHSVTFQDYGKSYTDNFSIKVLAADDGSHQVWCSARDHWHQSLNTYSTTNVAVDVWMHLACVFKRNDAEVDGEDEELVLYINGVQEDQDIGPLSEIETGGGPPVTLGCQT